MKSLAGGVVKSLADVPWGLSGRGDVESMTEVLWGLCPRCCGVSGRGAAESLTRVRDVSDRSDVKSREVL